MCRYTVQPPIFVLRFPALSLFDMVFYIFTQLLALYLITASMAEWLRACLKLRCAGGREFNPRPGQYSRMSFSS